ncbi:MAG: DNA polymerase [Candidatus Zixiibacteriota bacterium]
MRPPDSDEVRWLFLDLNSYFASVEQQVNPKLRGRPVGILPLLAETSCCIAASREAKKFGIRTGTLAREARRLCPGIHLIESRPQRYVEYHDKIVAAVESCTPVTAIHSIDEMACRLSRGERDPAAAVALARMIKRTIHDTVGEVLTCSVGLAPNKWLAKVGTDMQKPDGLVVIRQHDLPEILFTLQPIDLPGIGPRMNKRLEARGITTVKRLCELSEKQMRQLWGGIVGERFWHWLHGHDIPDVVTHQSSLGHSHVLGPDVRSEAAAYGVLQRLLHKAAARLRLGNLWTTGMIVFVKFYGDRSWEEKAVFQECQDTLTLLQTLQVLWRRRPSFEHSTPQLVGLNLVGLVPDEQHNLPLLGDGKREALSRALDRINAKYGGRTLYFGGIHDYRTTAPVRIGFTNIPKECDWA